MRMLVVSWAARLLPALAILALSACSSSSSNGSYTIPAMAPVVNAALPSKLRSSSSATQVVTHFNTAPHARTAPTRSVTNTANASVAATYISDLFSSTYNSINDGKGYQGFVNTQLLNIDQRMSGVSSQLATMGSTPTCLSATPTAYTVDLSALDSILKIKLDNLQCASGMTGNATGSGMNFGSTGTSYSMWLSMGSNTSGATFTGSGGFMVFANLKNYNSTDAANPEVVDGMFLSYSPASSNNNSLVTRFKASPSTNTFEMFLASNQISLKGMQSGANDVYVGAGFRMISDGTHVYGDGVLYNTTSGKYETFVACITASTMAVDATAGACDTVAAAFTLDTTASLTYAGVTGYPGAVIGSGTPCSNAADGHTISTCIPGPGPNSTQTTPTSTVINAYTAVFPYTTPGLTELSAGTTSGGTGTTH